MLGMEESSHNLPSLNLEAATAVLIEKVTHCAKYFLHVGKPSAKTILGVDLSQAARPAWLTPYTGSLPSV